MGPSGPPKNRVTVMADMVIVFMNSARKNRANRIDEYSVTNPPTSSWSASTRSKGGRLVSATPDGRPIHQMLFNCQMRPRGGDGWLRLLEMCPDRTMNVVDYSPTRNQCNESPKNKFSVPLARC